MSGVAEAVSILLSLTQAAVQATTAASEIATLVQKANSEGRDLSDGELDAVRKSALDARARLAA